ncbi:MAG: hypothetical protein AB7G75_22535 [Candidatus Binatia bacterium]
MNTVHAEIWQVRAEVERRVTESPSSISTVSDEIVTPEQFFTTADRTAIAWTGERRLLLAVLEDAIASYLRYRESRTTRGKRLFRETAEWFASPNHLSVCSFESICAYLNLDPEYIRKGLKRLPKQEQTQVVHPSQPFLKPRRVLRHLRVVPIEEAS